MSSACSPALSPSVLDKGKSLKTPPRSRVQRKTPSLKTPPKSSAVKSCAMNKDTRDRSHYPSRQSSARKVEWQGTVRNKLEFALLRQVTTDAGITLLDHQVVELCNTSSVKELDSALMSLRDRYATQQSDNLRLQMELDIAISLMSRSQRRAYTVAVAKSCKFSDN